MNSPNFRVGVVFLEAAAGLKRHGDRAVRRLPWANQTRSRRAASEKEGHTSGEKENLFHLAQCGSLNNLDVMRAHLKVADDCRPLSELNELLHDSGRGISIHEQH